MEPESGTRHQIVTATRKLIEHRGIAHITTRQIAQAAGCAEGTIFRHFERKEDLLLAAVLANFPSFKESLMSITGGSSRERLRGCSIRCGTYETPSRNRARAARRAATTLHGGDPLYRIRAGAGRIAPGSVARPHRFS